VKKIILTIDYELFLGEKTGTVKNCMIEPTKKLASILEKNNSRMTVFWDILHYYRLLELEKSYSELRQDRNLIEEQILNLASRSHDIQLHLHPHWLDAEYESGKWNFDYKRFKLHNLSDENNPNDINTIIGCVTFSKRLMEKLIKEVNPEYKVNTFRAGGYLIEPFAKIKEALLINEIKIDSSVCLNSFNDHGDFSFNFRSYPNKTQYNFELTPKTLLDNGSFLEVPITTVRIPALINILFKLFRRIKYPTLENERIGVGTNEFHKSNRISYFKKIYKYFNPRINQLTTDSNFKERLDYIINKVPNYSTMIIHPKLLNQHTLKTLEKYVSTDKFRFISIQDFLKVVKKQE
jgi:hypothetical protein